MNTIYRADDGTEFDCPKKCEIYEQHSHLRFLIDDMLTDFSRDEEVLSLKASLAFDEIKEHLTYFLMDKLDGLAYIYSEMKVGDGDFIKLKKQWKSIRREF